MENCNEQDCKHYYKTDKPCSYISELCFISRDADPKVKVNVDQLVSPMLAATEEGKTLIERVIEAYKKEAG